VGLQSYDVLQSTNVIGNILDNPFTALMGFDHMVWDGNIYPHLSANGKHPYFVLGKGLFYKAKDLVDLGSFNPWLTIEDPEVGLRLWVNGKRLGIIAEPLIEEVPQTFFFGGISQRNRWMCGFFQTLTTPLKQMGMSFGQRFLTWFNVIPPFSNLISLIGLPTGVIALSIFFRQSDTLSLPLTILSMTNIALFIITMGYIYVKTWQRTRLVIDDIWRRFLYMLWVNPFTLFIYAIFWCIPIIQGLGMFATGRGLIWIPTKKVDADHRLVRQ
jgi:glycosyltransferase XagB